MLDRVLNRAASHFDEVVTNAILHRRRRAAPDARAEALGHRARIEALGTIAALYDRPEHYDETGSFFPEAGPITPELRRARRIHGTTVMDATWSSGFSPFAEEVA